MFIHEIFAVIGRVLAVIVAIIFFVVVVRFAKNLSSAYDVKTGELDTSVKAAERFETWSNKIGTSVKGYMVEFFGENESTSETAN